MIVRTTFLSKNFSFATKFEPGIFITLIVQNLSLNFHLNPIHVIPCNRPNVAGKLTNRCVLFRKSVNIIRLTYKVRVKSAVCRTLVFLQSIII